MNSKKRSSKLVAAVVVAALTMPLCIAHADVSIYGIADIAYSQLDFGQEGTKSFITSGSGAGGSRLGVNASQKLDNGLTVKANYEAGVALDNSQGSPLFDTRQSWLGLSGQFGSITAGQDYTLSFLTAYRGEYCGWCGIASPAMLTMQGVRDGNYVKYVSPDFGGVSVGVGHTSGEDSANSGNLGDRTEGAVFYSRGTLNFAGSYRTSTIATDNKLTDYYLAGNVGLGVIKLYALLGSAKGSDTNTTDERYSNLGVVFKLGGGDLSLQYALTDDQENSDANTTLTAASYFYPLGNGTTFYAHVAKVTNEDNAARSTWPGHGANFTPATGEEANGIQVGMKYSF